MGAELPYMASSQYSDIQSMFKVISQIKTTVKKFPSSGLSVLVMNYLNLFDIPIFKHKRNRTLHFPQRGARASFTAPLGVNIIVKVSYCRLLSICFASIGKQTTVTTHTQKKTPRGTCRHTGNSWYIVVFVWSKQVAKYH
jgi:hypothetical protein